MSREVRRVPLDWQHPVYWAQRIDWLARDGSTRPVIEYKPLFQRAGYEDAVKEFQENPEDYDHVCPSIDDYMPDFSDIPEDKMGICMYETTSEGTPISPVFKDPDDLAHWLADNKASAFGGSGATYEQWKAMIDREWAPSMVFTPSTGLISGVEAISSDKEDS